MKMDIEEDLFSWPCLAVHKVICLNIINFASKICVQVQTFKLLYYLAEHKFGLNIVHISSS